MAWYLITTLTMAIASLAVYLYFQRRGQFEDGEEVKYQLFFEEEEDA